MKVIDIAVTSLPELIELLILEKENIVIAVSVARESDLLTIWRPGWISIITGIESEL